MFSVKNRHRLDDSTRDEFERLIAGLREFLSTAHDESGAIVQPRWQPYPVVWSSVNSPQPSLGNGVLQGRYVRAGDTVHFTMEFRAGSTTTFGSGTWVFSLPVNTMKAGVIGTVLAFGTQTAVAYAAGDIMLIHSNTAIWSASAPITWAADDSFTLSGTYEVRASI